MTTTVLYIAPASGDLLRPQARIYRAEFHGCIDGNDLHSNYIDQPDRWSEVGLMNHHGNLVCFDGTPEQRQELIDSQPLMAGLVFTFHPDHTYEL